MSFFLRIQVYDFFTDNFPLKYTRKLSRSELRVICYRRPQRYLEFTRVAFWMVTAVICLYLRPLRQSNHLTTYNGIQFSLTKEFPKSGLCPFKDARYDCVCACMRARSYELFNKFLFYHTTEWKFPKYGPCSSLLGVNARPTARQLGACISGRDYTEQPAVCR